MKILVSGRPNNNAVGRTSALRPCEIADWCGNGVCLLTQVMSQVVAPTRKLKNEIMTTENQKPTGKPEAVTTLAPSPCYARTSQARKILHDLMDSRRPWAHYDNVYDWMEEIVDMAEQAFTGRRRPTYKEWAEQEQTILKLTEPLKTHPEWHTGPCACEECRSA